MSLSHNPYPRRVVGILKGANLNTTADQAIGIDAASYIITGIWATNASGVPTLAAGGIYTGTGKTGTLLVPVTQLFTALTSATKQMQLTLQGVVSTDRRTEGTLYLSLLTANGSAVTMDLYIEAIVLG